MKKTLTKFFRYYSRLLYKFDRDLYKLAKRLDSFLSPIYRPIGKTFYRFRFQLSLIIIFSIGLFIILIYSDIIDNCLPQKIYNELTDKDKPFYLRNIIIALAAFATAIFTWWKNTINSSNNLIQEDSRLDELFAKAVDNLKESNDLTTRKGGVHILKDLATTSPKHVQKCIDMLCSINESWMPRILTKEPEFFKQYNNFPNIKDLKILVSDVLVEEKMIPNIYLSQLVLNTLSNIIKHISINVDYKDKYDLTYKYLCSIDLQNVNFKKFKLENINLQSANLYGANLKFVNIQGGNLNSVNLISANLQSAFLKRVQLRSAELAGAQLQSAFLLGAQLQSALLFGAQFRSAVLGGANFQFSNISNTNFSKSKLNYADFRNALNCDLATFDSNKSSAIFTDEDYESFKEKMKVFMDFSI